MPNRLELLLTESARLISTRILVAPAEGESEAERYRVEVFESPDARRFTVKVARYQARCVHSAIHSLAESDDDEPRASYRSMRRTLLAWDDLDAWDRVVAESEEEAFRQVARALVRARTAETSKVVASWTLPRIDTVPGVWPLFFRVDVIERPGGTFGVEVWRHELLRVQPSLPRSDGGAPLYDPSDETILVADDVYSDWDQLDEPTVEQAFRRAVSILAGIFSTEDPR